MSDTALLTRRTADVLADLVAADADPSAVIDWMHSTPSEKVMSRVDLLEATIADPEALLADPAIVDFAEAEAHERCVSETHSIEDDLWAAAASKLVRQAQTTVPSDNRPSWISSESWDGMVSAVAAADEYDQARTAEHLLDDSDELRDEATRRHVNTCLRGSVSEVFHSI